MTVAAPTLQRAHRETAAVFLVAGLAAVLVACHLSWNADVFLSIGAGTATGTALTRALAGRGTPPSAAAAHTVRTAVVAALAATAGTLLVALALGADGWGVLAVGMLMCGTHHLWAAARAA